MSMHITERNRKDFKIILEQMCVDSHYLVILIFLP